jgi:hypothetical protein
MGAVGGFHVGLQVRDGAGGAAAGPVPVFQDPVSFRPGCRGWKISII